MRAPCYLCPDRELYCHATCEKYKDYQKEREMIRAEKRKEKDIDIARVQNIQRTKARIKRNSKLTDS